MSEITEKNTQNMEATQRSEKGIEHDEVIEKVSPNGSEGETNLDGDFHFTFGKFMAIAVRTILLILLMFNTNQ